MGQIWEGGQEGVGEIYDLITKLYMNNQTLRDIYQGFLWTQYTRNNCQTGMHKNHISRLHNISVPPHKVRGSIFWYRRGHRE